MDCSRNGQESRRKPELGAVQEAHGLPSAAANRPKDYLKVAAIGTASSPLKLWRHGKFMR